MAFKRRPSGVKPGKVDESKRLPILDRYLDIPEEWRLKTWSPIYDDCSYDNLSQSQAVLATTLDCDHVVVDI